MLDVKKNVVAEIMMRRMSHTGSFLLLEGKDDVKFWSGHNHQACRLIDGGGKPNVISAMNRLETSRF